jgi:hypothetical protein
MNINNKASLYGDCRQRQSGRYCGRIPIKE